MPEEPDEDAKPKTAPIFVHKPESVQVEEGEWARFCVRVTGHPRPRVMWLLNGHTVVNVRIMMQLKQLRNTRRKFTNFLFYPQKGIAIQANIRWHVPFGHTKNKAIRYGPHRSNRKKFNR